jgi:hypothetical protein
MFPPSLRKSGCHDGIAISLPFVTAVLDTIFSDKIKQVRPGIGSGAVCTFLFTHQVHVCSIREPHADTTQEGCISPLLLFVRMMTETAYAAHTNHAFVLTETVTVAELIHQGATHEDIRQQVLVEDLFQLRSLASRERALRTVLKRLKQVPEAYIQLIATGNADIRRFTILFLILREHRLLRELIDEVLLDKIKGFDYVVTPADLRTFFERKREQSLTVAAWSESTYKKVASNTVLVLVNAGLLQPTSPRRSYEIRAVPVPSALRQQLLSDGQGQYLTLMLDG